MGQRSTVLPQIRKLFSHLILRIQSTMKAKNVVYVVFDEGNFMEKQTLFTIYMPLYVGRGLRNKLDSQ